MARHQALARLAGVLALLISAIAVLLGNAQPGSAAGAPSWDAGYPNTTNVKTDRLDLNLRMDALGTAYYGVYEAGAAPPSSTDLKTGGTPVTMKEIFLAKWGSYASGSDQFAIPSGVACGWGLWRYLGSGPK